MTIDHRPSPDDAPSEAQIAALVYAFYDKIRKDAALGPIFNTAIADWDPHLEKMCAFWSSVMRTSGRYHGNPMATHLKLKTVRPEHFARWLELFGETAHEIHPPALAHAFESKAQTIARSLQMGMFWRPAAAQASA